MPIFKKEKLKELISKESESKRHTILIVDDEEANLRSLKKLLEQHYNVITAKNGQEALGIVKSDDDPRRIHLIITDQRMPIMTGLQFIEQTINIIPQTKRMILTGFTDVDVIIDSINKGEIYQFVLKPFEPQDMLLTIKRALETYELEYQTIRLNNELKALNTHLEDKVKARTLELEKKNDFIIKQSNELKSLLHVLCHDLANPLNSVMGLLEVVRDDPGCIGKLIPNIFNSLKNGLDVIKLIRDLRALDEEKIQLEIGNYNLSQLISESVHILDHRFKEKNIELMIDINDEVNVKVERISMINSILNNILSNAIKFSFSGDRIEVSSEDVSEYVILSIKDYGVGMSKKLVSDLFELGKTTARFGTNGELGTGFGMPLVKKMMSMIGGGVEVYSTEKTEIQKEHGTEIKLLLQKV